ncbi:MAG: DUF5683 domain-containing protein [Mangrovibacterium sp.]|nr:DUF5683 domain-containing protein [Mangrovibacterium sp.]
MARERQNTNALTGLGMIIMAILTILPGVYVSAHIRAEKDTAIMRGSPVKSTIEGGSQAARDTVVSAVNDTVIAQAPVKREQKAHSPRKATIFSAVLPGLGQIYNRKYWKVPLVYIGFASLIYSIDWNNDYYVLYKQAYVDIVDDNPNSNSFKELDIEGHWDFDNPSQVQQFTTRLERAKESSRRYRDLCIVGAAAFYALNIIDATVDAHFFNFDIGDDLTMKWVPQPVYAMNQPLMGFHCVISF